jgi:pyruvate dehydrogenase E2 component (dihydrolipoamide acetyltransferase)
VSTPILMPALSPTMEEGKLVKWHVKEGDTVRSGDVIAEIETDKATMEVEAVDEGTMGRLLVAEGTEHVPVNHPIALLLTEDESSAEDRRSEAGSSAPRWGEVAAQSDAGEGARATADSGSPSPQPSPQRGEGGSQAEAATHSTSSHRGETSDGDGAHAELVMNQIAEQIRANGKNGHAKRVFASPLARRLARERGIQIEALNGSGPHGRIVKADVERAASAPQPIIEHIDTEPAEAEPVAAPTPMTEAREAPQRALVKAPRPAGLSDNQVLALYEPGSYELVPHDTMRRFIAERLTLSKQTIPHFYLAIDCELDAALAARARMNALAPQEGPRAFKLSVNDFIIKALAMALQTVPAANATWTEQGLLRHRASDIAVAVALEGGGLFTPVIRDAEVKSLSEISNEMRDLAARARSKRLAPHEYQGGSTTISNLGMYGIDRFDAVINPPQASIMAVGRAEKRPVVKDDALKIATMMSVTLSVDHRVIDGALGAELLAAFKAYIEDPVTMLV